LLLVAVASGLGFFWPFGKGEEELRLSGIVEIQEIQLGSKVGGRVARICVEEGEVVNEGYPLVYFEVPELEKQEAQWQARVKADQAALDRARNGPRFQEIEGARAAYEEAQARMDKMHAGFREEEKRQARNDLEAARADSNQAREDFDRILQLYPKSASRADYDTARAAYLRARARFEAFKAKNDMMATGNRPEDIREADAACWEALNKYLLLLEGTRPEDIRAAEAKLAESQGKLAEIQVNLKEAVVRAPDRAVIEVLGVRKGHLVKPNDPVVRILRARDLWVKVYVPETELGKVRLGQKAEVTIDSYPGRTFEGKVILVASIAEFTPRNIQSADERRHQVFGIKVQVDNTEGIFKSGMAAQVRLPLQK
jgi:multidrug resistance efflux pump